MLHRIYARLFNYFWLPCPLCGEDFGGHEWQKSGFPSIATDDPYQREGICANCAARYPDLIEAIP